jgi:IclR family transcriptional regulator, acetate operon repressor
MKRPPSVALKQAKSARGDSTDDGLDDVRRSTDDGLDDVRHDVAGSSSIQGVERALNVLTLFAYSESRTLGVTEISRSLGLSKAVVHRILTAFRTNGFLQLEPTTHRYMLGPQILSLGLTVLNRIDTHGIIREEMGNLSAETNETATFSVRVGWQRVYVDQVTPDREVKVVVQIGNRFPLHSGASSRALLAALPQYEQEEYLADHELAAITSSTITDPHRLRQELAEVRRLGYAVSVRERDEGAAAVAAPIYGHDEQLIGVISVSGPVERFQPQIDQAASALCRAVERIGVQLGRQIS